MDSVTSRIIERSTMDVMAEFERPSPNSARATRAYPLAPEDFTKAVERAVEKLPRWSLESKDAEKIHAVRESRIFRFKDDVTVNLSTQNNGTEARFESASRVGKSDLGQNPRNLRELLKAVNEELV